MKNTTPKSQHPRLNGTGFSYVVRLPVSYSGSVTRERANDSTEEEEKEGSVGARSTCDSLARGGNLERRGVQTRGATWNCPQNWRPRASRGCSTRILVAHTGCLTHMACQNLHACCGPRASRGCSHTHTRRARRPKEVIQGPPATPRLHLWYGI